MGNEGRDGEWGSGGVVGSGGEGGTEVTMWRGCFAVGNGVAGIKSFFLFFFKDYPSILVSDFSNVAFRSAPISSVDKHQHFSLDSIRLKLAILLSDVSNVASRSTPVSPVDKHQHFSLDSIRLRLE